MAINNFQSEKIINHPEDAVFQGGLIIPDPRAYANPCDVFFRWWSLGSLK